MKLPDKWGAGGLCRKGPWCQAEPLSGARTSQQLVYLQASPFKTGQWLPGPCPTFHRLVPL